MAETLEDRITNVLDQKNAAASSVKPPMKIARQPGIKKSSKSRYINLFIALATPVIITAVFITISLPKFSANKYLSGLEIPVSNTKDSLSKVNKNLTDMLNLIMGDEDSKLRISSTMDLTEAADRLKDVLDSQGEVAGLSIGLNTNMYQEFSDRAKRMRAAISNFTKSKFSATEATPPTALSADLLGEGEVAGTEDIEGPLIASLREVKEHSKKGQENISDSKVNLELLKNSLNPKYPTKLKSIYNKIDLLIEDTDSYLSEAKKTADYYDMITGVSIELVPAVTSINILILDLVQTSQPGLYIDKIDELFDTISDLENTLSNYPSSKVPKGLENLHADNIATLELIDKTLKDIKEAVTANDALIFSTAVTKFGIDLEVLSTRAQTYELSFWQNSKLFKNYEALSGQFQDSEKQIIDLKKENKVPFLN